MIPEVRWERMFPDQLEARFAASPVVYFPYGLCEPHGPQCAVGLDALKAHALCCAAAREHGGIVAPPDYWHIHEMSGYASWAERWVGEVERTWLTAMPPWQHFRNVLYHVRAADALGFHAAIFLTGHYGPNWNDLKTLLEWVQPHTGTRLYGLPDFEANTPGFDGDGKSSGDHAGRVETSLLWALEPACVDVSRLPAPDAPGPHFAMGPTAPASNRRTGERMVADEVRWLGAKAAELRSEYARLRPEHRLRTWSDVERLWDEVVRPRFRELTTMQPTWAEREPPAETSRWRANWPVPDVGLLRG
jgi:creatinine amidohydrolase